MRPLKYICLALPIFLIGIAPPAAHADRKDLADQTAGLIAKVEPIKSPKHRLKKGQKRAKIAGEEASVTVSTDPNSTIILDPTDTQPSVGVALPKEVRVTDSAIADDGTLVHVGDAGAQVAVQVVEEGSVRIHTILSDATAPKEYTYKLDIPETAHLQPLEDGSILIAQSDGSFLGGVTKPWAKDADGVAVPTHYRIEGQNLIQVIETNPATRYPVVADPWLGVNLYSRVYVSYPRSGRWVVNATPSAWGHVWNGVATYGAHTAEVRSRVGASRYTSTIQSQHLCHVMGFPLSLPEYNLESWRPYQNPAWSLARYRCNP